MFVNKLKNFSFIILLFSLISGCTTISKVFKSESPRDKYEQKIKQSGLLETVLGESWLQAGQKCLKDSLNVSLPYLENGYFFQDRAEAVSFRFKAKRGEILTIHVLKDSLTNFSIFADLFLLEDEKGTTTCRKCP